MRIFASIIFALFSITLAHSQDEIWHRNSNQQAKSWAVISEESRNSIVFIEANVAQYYILKPFLPPVEGTRSGSGFFINNKGYILTAAHVLGGFDSYEKQAMLTKPLKVTISTINASSEKFETEIVGIFQEGDIALLKINDISKFMERNPSLNKKIEYLSFDCNKDCEIPITSAFSCYGAEILSLGDHLGKKNITMTTGIISLYTKEIDPYQYIQTTAPFNKGCSGGPSLNKFGGVIGMNIASLKGTQNMNYIIPSRYITIILEQLFKYKKANFSNMGILWLRNDEHTSTHLNPECPKDRGIIITEIIKGSTAEEAKLKSLDVLTKIDDIEIDHDGIGISKFGQELEPFTSFINKKPVNSKFHIEYYREGNKKEADITMLKIPDLPIRELRMNDNIDYFIWGGIVFQNLNISIINSLSMSLFFPFNKRYERKVVITHVFSTSQADKSKKLEPGYIIEKLNDKDIFTVDDVKSVLRNIPNDGYLVIKATDQGANNKIVALNVNAVNKDESRLNEMFRYK